jgi:hypothetical protein
MFVHQSYHCISVYTYDNFLWAANEGSEELILYIDLSFKEL